MHYQEQPHAEAKLVRCTRGALFDVIIDVRPESPTYCKWVATSLTADNHRMLYVPRGCAHGFQTLEDHSEVFYQVSHPYSSQHARGALERSAVLDPMAAAS
jgi:dTDP-4-dehydrorhamnose 3,5-epimerase